MRFKISDDKKLVKSIRDKIKENGGYCPCKIEKNEDTKCICKEFLTQDKLGACHCGLYIKTE